MNVKILIGPPCSGKSTYAKEFCEKNLTYRIISRDSVREMLYGSYKMVYKDEPLISEICQNLVSLLLNEGHDIILDNTNCNLKYFKKELEYLSDYQCVIKHELFLISEEEFKIRNIKRSMETGKTIPLEVFQKMYKSVEDVINFINIDPYYDEK